MKRHLLIALLTLVTTTLSMAQTGKGHKFIGGSFYYNYDEAGTVSYITYPQGNTQYFRSNLTSFNISPEFGVFLSDKLTLSVQPGFSRVSGTETSYYYSNTNALDNYVYTNDYYTNIIGLAINARYYIPLADKVAIYPQLGISSNHVLNNFTVGSLNIGGGPNVVFFPTKKLGLNMGFGNINYNYNYQTNGSTVNLSLNNSFSFGVNYYWGGKN